MNTPKPPTTSADPIDSTDPVIEMLGTIARADTSADAVSTASAASTGAEAADDTGTGPANERVAVEFDRPYATSAADLWQACTDPARLERWMARVTGDLSVGGRFVIHFDDDDTPECTVTSCDPPHGFTWEWPIDGVPTRVTVAITADPADPADPANAEAPQRARLRLRHERLTLDQAAGYGAGWDTYVRALDAHVEAVEAPDWGRTWNALHPLYQSVAQSFAQ